MGLHIKAPGVAPGLYPLVTRGREMKHLSFAVLQLDAGCPKHRVDSGEEELALRRAGLNEKIPRRRRVQTRE